MGKNSYKTCYKNSYMLSVYWMHAAYYGSNLVLYQLGFCGCFEKNIWWRHYQLMLFFALSPERPVIFILFFLA